MDIFTWAKIILQIIILIGEGIPKKSAVSSVAEAFGISESDIWNHGGF